MYKPKPIDTSKIVLPEDAEGLVEMLARNCHDNWAKERIKQGWSYGSARNDERKETPCLVPYEELPESEKEFDRITSIETIKTIMSLGYKIVKQ